MDLEPHLPQLQSAADYHARRIVRSLHLPFCDFEDVRQDLLVGIIERMGRFDPDRASFATFLDLLARHGAHAVVRRLRRHQRLFGPAPVSIDDQPLGSDEPPLREALTAERSLETRNAFVDAGLAVDVARTVTALPVPLRFLCVLLTTEPSSAVRRRSRLSRATFYRRLRDIRLHFLAEGLRPAA
jgi:DNA-directed RNA polymerase specialized sigma24 family protein